MNPANGSGGGTGGSGGSNLTGGNVVGVELSNATLAREYIWGPGGSFVGASVDELLVQIDGDGRAAWVMQDAGGDVVALAVHAVSSTGGAANGSDAVAATGVNASNTGTNLSFRVAAQQEYDAYGQVIWAEHLLNHAALHVGHKGLFVDRLDVGVGNGSGSGGNGNPGASACAKTFGEPPRIVPLAFNLAQNRNRVLHTSWGRYLQQDPNASGMGASDTVTCSGTAPAAGVQMFGLTAVHGDGANLYLYLRCSPVANSDPLGLLVEEILAPYATIGFTAGRIASELINQYSQNLSDDVDWATDWSAPDDWHTRNDNSWIQDIYDEADINGTVNGYAEGVLGATPHETPFQLASLGGLAGGGANTQAGLIKDTTRWFKWVHKFNAVGKVGHHVVSIYGQSKRWFEGIKAKHGFDFSLWDLRNMLPLDPGEHGGGRHRKVYHAAVQAFFETRLGNLTGKEARKAFTDGLHELKRLIRQNPDDWFRPQ